MKSQQNVTHVMEYLGMPGQTAKHKPPNKPWRPHVGQVLVHNHVSPTRRLGMRGFRAWLSPADRRWLEVCDCGWAPELGTHFRVRRRPGGFTY